jgi:hypothetical protein
LKAGLKAFGEAAEVEVRGAEERVTGLHPVEVVEEHVLRVLGAAVIGLFLRLFRDRLCS